MSRLLYKEMHSRENFTEIKYVSREVLKEIGDVQLWQEFQLGNEEAFAMIYKKNVSPLYNYGLKIVNDKELVKDCIQDLFVEIWNNRTYLGKVISIRSYLYTCIRRKIISVTQKNRMKVSDTEKNAVLDSLYSFSEERSLIEKQNFEQQKRLLNVALTKLTNRQREVLHLKYIAQLSYNEITQIMSLSKKGAYKLVDRALQGLRKHM
ncbi:sigma-70 family RNA polymerase sigma factor [Algibacter agarivorans]|uniref:Sigma-70 family RNA polymerase sigma factor n=1 Tax=Algibacter agarivorans TaxID=1109741 RepID=A0ABP9GDX0_9FLAO